MKKFTRIFVLASILLCTLVGTLNAAFPKEKIVSVKNELAVTSSILTDKATTNEAELKTELTKITSQKENQKGLSGKSKITAALLAFFLGGFGVHSFYMGNNKKGFIQLGITILGLALVIAGIASFATGATVTISGTILIGYLLLFGVGIWAFVDFIRILTGGLTPEEGFND